MILDVYPTKPANILHSNWGTTFGHTVWVLSYTKVYNAKKSYEKVILQRCHFWQTNVQCKKAMANFSIKYNQISVSVTFIS